MIPWRFNGKPPSGCLSLPSCNQWREWATPGPWFNIKMSSYQHRKSHCGDKTILRPSFLHNGISYTIWNRKKHISSSMPSHIFIGPHPTLIFPMESPTYTITETTSTSSRSNIIIWMPGWHRSNIHIGIMGQMASHAITWKKTTSPCLPLKIHITRPCSKTWLVMTLVPAQLITSITLWWEMDASIRAIKESITTSQWTLKSLL